MKYIGKVYAKIGNIHVPLRWDNGKEIKSEQLDEIYEILKKLYNSAITTVGDQVIIRTDVNSIIELGQLLKELE